MVPDTTKSLDHLIPEKHSQQDLFICDVADAVLKDIMPQLEHPFYSLSKKPDMNVRRYEHNGNWIEIVPSFEGLATIYDKDILIYCISQIMAMLKRGQKVERKVRINSHELLMFCNRGVSGRDYQALTGALKRLSGTQINTNVRVSSDEEEFTTFSLIDKASLRRKFGLDGRLLWCDITLSDWVFDAIRANDVLTLHRDYFRLRKPIERRIYEVARKHCGQQREWSISLALLLKKTGSSSPEKRFRFAIREIAKWDHLPDYRITHDRETDKVTFHNRGTMPVDRLEVEVWKGHISANAFEQVGTMNLDQDKYALEQEFREWLKMKEIVPKNADALFIKFCRGRKRDLFSR